MYHGECLNCSSFYPLTRKLRKISLVYFCQVCSNSKWIKFWKKHLIFLCIFRMRWNCEFCCGSLRQWEISELLYSFQHQLGGFLQHQKNSEYALRHCAIALVVFWKDQAPAIMPFTIQDRSCFLREECVQKCWETASFLISVWPKCSVFLGKVCLDCTLSGPADACYPPRWLFSPREVNRLLCSGVPWQRLLLPLPVSAEQGCSV